MGFKSTKRTGNYWNDAIELDKLIKNFPFHTTGKNERDFENGFATTLLTLQNNFNANVITQIDKTTTVQSVYCFGKKHRPDMTLDEDGIAIELKFINYDGLKDAIGQGHFYRLRYRFVFLILIMSDAKKETYEDINNKQEKDLEDILDYLAKNLNIFTYIVPSFDASKIPGLKKCISFFP